MTAPASNERPPSSRRRRLDPTGKHALFSTPVSAAPDQLTPGSRADGRDAFYSSGPRRAGTVVVTCSACHARSRVTAVDLAVRLLSISAWLPVRRRFPHWLRCPSCEQHRWCHIDWGA